VTARTEKVVRVQTGSQSMDPASPYKSRAPEIGRQRNQNLDCLRAVAVFMVLCRHFRFIPGSSHGWAGVDLFFVLSGFLIGGLLFQQWKNTDALQIRRFYLRRALKLYPSFYFLIAATAAVSFWVGQPITTRQALVEVFFLQSYLNPSWPPGGWGGWGAYWPHTWSLAVEEHFYILLPLALWIMSRYGRRSDPFRHVITLFAVAAIACPIFRVITDHGRPSRDLTATLQTHLRVDALLFGVLLCYLNMFRPEVFKQWARSRLGLFMAFLAVTILLIFPKETHFMKTIGLTIVYVGFGFLVIRVAHGHAPHIGQPIVRLLAKIGFHSYPIYLWHEAVLRAVLSWIPEHYGFLQFAVYVVGCIIAGVAASRLIEIPVLAYRDRHFPQYWRSTTERDEKFFGRASSKRAYRLSEDKSLP
jgi:peptidoglycan/LPS O-acetylase OafA/YrhL